MRFKLIFTVIASLLFIVLSGCAEAGGTDTPPGSQPFQVGEVVKFSGVVIGQIDDCIVDGICAYTIETERGAYNAIWAEGMIRCEEQFDPQVTMGDTVEVSALVIDTNSASICSSGEYFIRKVS